MIYRNQVVTNTTTTGGVGSVNSVPVYWKGKNLQVILLVLHIKFGGISHVSPGI